MTRIRGRLRLVTGAAVAIATVAAMSACSSEGSDRRPSGPPPSPRAVSSPATSRAPTTPATVNPTIAPSTQQRTEPSGLPAAPTDGFAGPVTVTFDGAPPLRVEIASRPDQRARGLMQRAELQAGTGMLFLFSGRSSGGFWMLGTLIPLSIAYVDGSRVVSIAEMEPCPPATTRCPTYHPGAPYTAAVEAPGGFFTEHGIGPGAAMTIVGPTPSPR